MTHNHVTRACEYIKVITGHWCRHHYDEIVGFPFEFICDNGHSLAGEVRAVEIAPDEFIRLWTDASLHIEWRWEQSSDTGAWSKPKLYTHVFGGRPGTLVLKPLSHKMR